MKKWYGDQPTIFHRVTHVLMRVPPRDKLERIGEFDHLESALIPDDGQSSIDTVRNLFGNEYRVQRANNAYKVDLATEVE